MNLVTDRVLSTVRFIIIRNELKDRNPNMGNKMSQDEDFRVPCLDSKRTQERN